MKLATFETRHGARHIGALTTDGQALIDFTAADPTLADMLRLIDGGSDALARARAIFVDADYVVALDRVRLLAPLPVPRQMRDCLTFEKHLVQAAQQRFRREHKGEPELEAKLAAATAAGQFKPPPVWYQQPIYYKANRFSVIGHGTDIEWPSYSDWMDYELEFGIVLGKTGRDIPREQARDYIFGYTIFNDISARDAQYAEMVGRLGPAKGKDFDTGNVLGPWLVTADEIPHPDRLTMIARINGEEWSRGISGDMQHSFEDILAHISSSETLHAGEFIGSGTVGGGCGIELGRRLSPGDVIELEVEGIGVLRNRIVRRHA
jgi:2-keto-4-pentenoate hydratase/2-oxohepta-3-ene-1,7-dioic acid hydratase in catechol pathway